MAKYIYQYNQWPDYTWDHEKIDTIFGEIRYLQGILAGQMKSIGFSTKNEASLLNLTNDVVKSSEIEGEHLDYNKVRSSIARRLGINIDGMVASDRNTEGVVEMILDATQNYQTPLTEDRLFSWHAALFPTGYSGLYKIDVAKYRTGEMQIISGPMGKEKIHYQAIESQKVKPEMDRFINWFNDNTKTDLVIKAAIAHFWFIIIHPFDDGNGRIARALTDLILTRLENGSGRFYSMSEQILIERKKYYEVLQNVQYSSGDITEWLEWFMNCLRNALLSTQNTLSNVLQKAEFWRFHENTPLNERQRLVLNRLLDGFDGKLKTSKWAKIAKCSTDTALRDIKDLLDKGILKQEPQGGRSTNYLLSSPENKI